MNKLRVTLIACLLPAFTTLGVFMPPAQPSGCVATVVKAVTTPAHAVRGSFACLSDAQQFSAAIAGYDQDSGLQKLAAERGRTHARFIGASSDGAFIYELSGKGVSSVTLLIYVDGSGRVTRIDSDQATP